MSNAWLTLSTASILDVVVDDTTASTTELAELKAHCQHITRSLRRMKAGITLFGLQPENLPPAFQHEDLKARMVISARRRRDDNPQQTDEPFIGLAFYSEDGRAVSAPYLVCDAGIPECVWDEVNGFAAHVGLHDAAPDEPLSSGRNTMRGAPRTNDGAAPKPQRWRTTGFIGGNGQLVQLCS